MGMTVSISKGRTAILHDIRKEISANVDKNLIKNNEIFINELDQFGNNLIAYTDAHFQPYIDKYNEGKKPSRQIQETYTEHIAKENDKLIKKAEENKIKGVKSSVRKPTQLAHESVLQFGNHETNSTLQMENETKEDYEARMEDNREGLREALEQIKEKYPHARILLATYHQDEPNGTPHVHMLCQFEGEGYQKGLSHQISMSKALELDGLERSQNRGDYAINRWTKDISDNILEPALEKHLSQNREILGEHRKHEDIVFFREKARKEAEALQQERSYTQDTHDRLDDRIHELRKEALGQSYTIQANEETISQQAASLTHLSNQIRDQEQAITDNRAILDEQHDTIDFNDTLISQNTSILNEQNDQIEAQSTEIASNTVKLDELKAEIEKSSQTVKTVSKAYERVSQRVESHSAPEIKIRTHTVVDQPKGLLREEISHKEHFVSIPASSPEDAEAIKREIGDLYTKQYSKEAFKDIADASERQVKEKADQMLANAQNRIRQADNVLAQQQQILQQANTQAQRIKEKAEQERMSMLKQAKLQAQSIVEKAQNTLESLKNKILILTGKRDKLQDEVDHTIEQAQIQAEAIIQEAHKQAGTDKLYEAINERLGIIPIHDVAEARQKVLDSAGQLADVLSDSDLDLITANDAEGVYSSLKDKTKATDMRPWTLYTAMQDYQKALDAPHDLEKVLEDVQQTMNRSVSHGISR